MIAWALLVGIHDYPSDLVENVPGALKDVENVENYLLNDLHVPPSHILVLRDAQATREAILKAFQHHLVNNPAIGVGDPLIFHFSGHGTRGPAPRSWPMSWRAREDEDRMLEMIVPYDAVGDPRSGRETRASGIPDRTLGALIRRAADKHGRNITVMLDCCNSGHGTRHWGGPKARRGTRSIDPAYVGLLKDDTDGELWANDEPSVPRQSYLRSAFVDRNEDTHVLFAACSRYEDANAGQDGGWFTMALLEALRDQTIVPRTYAEILRAVRRIFDDWYRQMRESLPAGEWADAQTPQCEGMNRDRLVFQTTAVDPARFAVLPCPDSVTACIIEAGEVHGGIRPGSQFELRQFFNEPGQIGKDVVLGTAVALEVSAGRCRAQLPPGVYIPPSGVRAFVTNITDPLKYAIVNDQPGSSLSAAALNHLQENLSLMSTDTRSLCVPVESERDADLVFHVDAEYIRFERKDPHTSYLDIRPPPVKVRDINTIFPGCMSYFARFNHHLAHDSPTHPFAKDVEFHLHRLVPPDEPLAGRRPEATYMLPGPELEFSGSEATVQFSPKALFGIVLRNNTQYNLYPYIFFFDPSTYGIERFYDPASDGEPPLRAGGELHIGRSVALMAAIELMIEPGTDRATDFMKIYLATEPLSLGYMEQAAVLGYDEWGHPTFSHTRGSSMDDNSPAPLRSQWDVIVRKITTVAPPPNA